MITYKKAGVDINAGNALVRRLKHLSPLIGGFAGVLPLPKRSFRAPMLVSCADGVGTKLKIAFLSGKHDTVGIDLVAMNVNDLLCCGARPLFFLDYFACGKLDVSVAQKVIAGIMGGCRMADCVLLGGETAEMPGFYPRNEYDLAGFAVGVVDKDRLIDGSGIREKFVLVGLPSSGLHSNGFSLVRKLFSRVELKRRAREFLTPTRIYVRELLPLLLLRSRRVAGIAHITGGGFIDNIPRILPKGLRARFRYGSWPIPPIFHEIKIRAKLPDQEMFRTFNMGIGMVLVVPPVHVGFVQRQVSKAYIIGEIEKGPGGVRFD